VALPAGLSGREAREAASGRAHAERAGLGQPAGAGSAAPVLAAIGRQRFFRLAGAGRQDGEAPRGVPAALLGGFLASGTPIGFVLRSDGDEAKAGIGFAASEDAAELAAGALATAMGATRPGVAPDGFAASSFRALGCLQGVPHAAPDRPGCDAGADLLLDALHGHPLAVAVLATPAPPEELRRQLDQLGQEAEALDRDYLAMPQQADVHRSARRRRDWLDAMIERLERGIVSGLWCSSLLVGTDSPERTLQALGLLAGSLSRGSDPALLPLRAALCDAAVAGSRVHSNLLFSEELASYLLLPRRDRLGFALRDDVRFDVDHPHRAGGIGLGTILDGDEPTGRQLTIPPVALTRHAFVAGHTGSGKTTLVKRVLRELARDGVPFLVLEPAKSEYRALAAEIDDGCVFSVGEVPRDREIPFQLNPFSFPDGFALHTHVDLLKNAFTSAFGFVPPAPYLLESALYRAYEDRGWNLTTGRHPSGTDPLVFPILSDLLAAVDPVVEEAGYDVEISLNLRGALRTRIGNLCLGPKGMALDTRECVPDRLLFGRPLVLELRHLGSDAEKAFLMSIVLMRLYELRESAGATSGPEHLRHLLVVEEAHRLLRRQAERPGEEGNMAHEAVRAFENLVSEVRAYGQGVLLVDQLPSNISPGALKQTALKVIHRLIPKEDREAVGDLLSEPQRRALALLPMGDAVVHAEGMDGAVRVRVPAPNHERPAAAERGRVAERVRQSLEPHEAARLMAGMRRAPYTGILTDAFARAAADAALLAAAEGRSAAAASLELQARIRRLSSSLPAGDTGFDPTDATRLALEDALLRRALHYGWTRDRFESLVRDLADGLEPLATRLPGELRRPQGPHPWCNGCRQPCRYGFEGSILAADSSFAEAVGALDGKSRGEWIDRVAESAGHVASTLLPGTGPAEDLVACATAKALARYGLAPDSIEAVMSLVIHHSEEETDE